VVFAVLAGIFAARRVTRPLNALGAAADDMAEGNLDARAPESKLVEYELLAKQFNRMASHLASNIANLESDRAALKRLLVMRATNLKRR